MYSAVRPSAAVASPLSSRKSAVVGRGTARWGYLTRPIQVLGIGFDPLASIPTMPSGSTASLTFCVRPAIPKRRGLRLFAPRSRNFTTCWAHACGNRRSSRSRPITRFADAEAAVSLTRAQRSALRTLRTEGGGRPSAFKRAAGSCRLHVVQPRCVPGARLVRAIAERWES